MVDGGAGGDDDGNSSSSVMMYILTYRYKNNNMRFKVFPLNSFLLIAI